MHKKKLTFFQWALMHFNEFRRVYSALVWEAEPKRNESEIVWENVNRSVKVICRILPRSKKRSREIYIDGKRQENWDLVE